MVLGLQISTHWYVYHNLIPYVLCSVILNLCTHIKLTDLHFESIKYFINDDRCLLLPTNWFGINGSKCLKSKLLSIAIICFLRFFSLIGLRMRAIIEISA